LSYAVKSDGTITCSLVGINNLCTENATGLVIIRCYADGKSILDLYTDYLLAYFRPKTSDLRLGTDKAGSSTKKMKANRLLLVLKTRNYPASLKAVYAESAKFSPQF